jgi:hypothetical protein
MALDEQAYIALCRQHLEKKYAFGNGNGYTQRDLELLAHTIEEKTGTIISLSTLKRLWKGNFKQSPQLATLNALAVVLNYKDWQEFKLQNQPVQNQPIPKRVITHRKWMVPLLVLVLLSAVFFALNRGKKGVKVNGPLHFSTQKTVSSGIPNTVIFNYDLSNVEAEEFYIQQTWNELHRMRINPKGKAYTSIYYEPGYHKARLYANDSLLAVQPVHILSDGWEPHLYYSMEDKEPLRFKKGNFIKDGKLHLDKELLRMQNVDLSKSFYTRISNSREFKVSSDNFQLLSRIKTDSLADKLCPWMEIIIVTEKHIFSINLQNKGCERYASYKTGEVFRSGEDNDLSALGVKVYEWQEVEIRVENKNAEISINGKVVFRETYTEDYGNIMALLYNFDGTGSLDHVRLTDGSENMVFEDDFSRELSLGE